MSLIIKLALLFLATAAFLSAFPVTIDSDLLQEVNHDFRANWHHMRHLGHGMDRALKKSQEAQDHQDQESLDRQETADQTETTSNRAHRVHRSLEDDKEAVLSRDPRNLCGPKISRKVYAVCNGVGSAVKEFDLSTYCCNQKCDDAFIKSIMCPDKED